MSITHSTLDTEKWTRSFVFGGHTQEQNQESFGEFYVKLYLENRQIQPMNF